MTTGELIRAARKKAGLTQKQLGELCGIAEPTIRRYELGKLNPKRETLQKIAKPLGVHVSRLYGDMQGDALGDFVKYSYNANKSELTLTPTIHPDDILPDLLKLELDNQLIEVCSLFSRLNIDGRVKALQELRKLLENEDFLGSDSPDAVDFFRILYKFHPELADIAGADVDGQFCIQEPNDLSKQEDE